MKRYCNECRQAYEAKKVSARFCGAACRSTFNNRRKVRGAELYDLFMAQRHDRKAAQEAGVWKRLCRLAQSYKAQDDAEDLVSYDLKEAMERTFSHEATIVGVNVAGNRR